VRFLIINNSFSRTKISKSAYNTGVDSVYVFTSNRPLVALKRSY